MTLWLMRHARVELAAGVCYGVFDCAADARATARAAQALAEQLPHQLAVAVSPLRRCVQLAEALGHLRPDLVFTRDPRLAELDFGCWEGIAWAQIPRAALDAWVADFGAHRFGGAESANALMARVASAWDAHWARSQDAAWITHAGVLRAVALLQQGVRQVDSAAQWPLQSPAFGELRVLRAPTPGAGNSGLQHGNIGERAGVGQMNAHPQQVE